MNHQKKFLSCLCGTLCILAILSACVPKQSDSPLPSTESAENPTYEYTVKSAFYPRPSFTDEGARLDAQTTTTENGYFYCFTEDLAQADGFIQAQTELLSFLKEHGVELKKLHFYGVDYDDNFSESSINTAHIAFSSLNSWKQVLVTLQTLWGDSVEYGYVYALSNAIASKLGWTTDQYVEIAPDALNAFFAANPCAIGLLYPTFTTDFASEETVNSCKTLSSRLLEKVDLNEVLALDIETQLERHHDRLRAYAESISIPYVPQTIGYSYYGVFLPLRIQLTYAEMYVDADYHDVYYGTPEDCFGDYWGDYASIYETASVIDQEIQDTVAYFGLQDEAGMAHIQWLSRESAIHRAGKPLVNHYIHQYQQVVVTAIMGYAHEYYHHIQHILNPNTDHDWQAQAFCEIGGSRSYYGRLPFDTTWPESEQWVDLFRSFTGRTYEPGTDDYFEAYDILCYILEEYDLDYRNGRNPINSFSRYLMDQYGQRETLDLMLYPDTVEAVTQHSWQELQEDWKQSIMDKYAGTEIPSWINEFKS